MSEIISFQRLRIERNHRKICTCNPPRYEIDTVNHIVVCLECNAVVDSFEVLTRIAERMEELEEFQKRAKETAENWKQIADREYKRRMKYNAIREMDRQYRNDMLPICPKCNKVFEPTDVNCYVNRVYADIQERECKDA